MRQLIISQTVTNRTATLEKYLYELSKSELLSAEEEVALAKRIQQGDQAALERLVKANLRFVISVAKKYAPSGIGLEDMIEEGNLGLIKAARTFDPTRGFKFISYAVWWIRQAIMHYIADKNRIIRLPGNQIVGIAAYKKANELLEQQLEREPLPNELAEHMEQPVDKVTEYMKFAAYTFSLDKVMGDEDNSTLLDVLQDASTAATDSSLVNESLRTELSTLVSRLPGRSGQVLKLHYGLDGTTPLSMEDIAVVMNLGKERVRQLHAKGIDTLKYKAPETLRDYL